ncbi:MAG: prephenate dehydrogenase/arogenate dehydrogenase family protein [Deltaproteobacteria bacterium HGW-Deltaproteobacteria-14]|jgi:prephenate dehydrogenase|nr:MAG: prephenate dehydrogenase/arogenate dehydrogenase family protein [Deltaproteobacteria bacterium HGW-Deltaproteobacteria-14]
MEPRYGKVGVFGMGLLGGSIALGLRERFIAGEVHAYDLDAEALDAALAMGAADRVHTTPGPWIGELELGVLAAPVRALPGLAAAVAPFAAPTSRWIDVGSVKAPVVAALSAQLPGFVGTHPMAGRETPGMQNAYAGLLQNAVWVVTPTADTDPASLIAADELIEGLGAIPFHVPPDVHDRLVARVSHVPYLLAVALNLLIARDAERERLLFLAAGGFRDLTRVASGAPEMSRDMVVENRDAVREALADLSALVADLAATLDDPAALIAAAQEAKRTRDALPVVKRTLLPRVFDVVVALPDRPLELAHLTTVLGEHGVNIRDIEVLKIRGAGGEAIRVGVADGDDQERARAVLRAAGYRTR